MADADDQPLENPLEELLRHTVLDGADNCTLLTAGPTDAPQLLWHYSDAAGALGIIQERELWGTNALFMNDKSELRLVHDLFAERFAADDSGLGSDDREIFESAFWLSLDETGDDPGIYAVCFCEDGDLLGQWRTYATAGGGYALGFDSASMVDLYTATDSLDLFRVVYDRTTQSGAAETLHRRALAVAAEFSKANPSLSDQALATCGQGMAFVAQWLAFRIKHDAFKEEREWRLMYRDITQVEDSLTRQFRTGPRGIIPYVSFPLRDLHQRVAGDDADMPLVAVRVGPTAQEDLSVRGMDYLLADHGFGCRAQTSRIPLRA